MALYSADIAQKSWLSIGIVGPASGTEQLQGSIHKLLGASTPQGWPYQVENTATFQLL
ncbi:lipid A-modifier LpxR family protein [Colwellia sp. 12G3]|uniref:lipid A-modifier LpxR family protein n=1 Tax=Colwellia sp. 12G3 TaxID=2058299 RepID=UPI001E2B7203|nr:lipid A-modifier LpxR family protein [Colwellia sp. 12G3]